MIKFKLVQNHFEEFFVKINLMKKKWLLLKHPNRINIVNHMNKSISAGLDQLSATTIT